MGVTAGDRRRVTAGAQRDRGGPAHQSGAGRALRRREGGDPGRHRPHRRRAGPGHRSAGAARADRGGRPARGRATGRRARRGRTAVAALREAVPDAGDVHVVNNGAAALVLTATALAAGREIIVSRGELVEIGDGFRLPDLLVSTGARLREVGTTNRTSLADY